MSRKGWCYGRVLFGNPSIFQVQAGKVVCPQCRRTIKLRGETMAPHKPVKVKDGAR